MTPEEEITKLRRENEYLIGRLAAACEVLSRKANGQGVPCPHCGKPLDWRELEKPRCKSCE